MNRKYFSCKFVLFFILILIVAFFFGCAPPRLQTIPPNTESDPYIRLSKNFDYASEGYHVDSTSLVILPDEPPNEWKSDPLQATRYLPFICCPLSCLFVSAGDAIERNEEKKEAQQLFKDLKPISVIKTTELESQVLDEAIERLCRDKKCPSEKTAEVHIILKPVIYLSGNKEIIQMVYNLWVAIRDNNKPDRQKGWMVSFYYQSEMFPAEKWMNNDWELLNSELEKAIIETSDTLHMILQKKSKEEINEKMGGRNIDFYQRGRYIPCYIIKTFDTNTGKRHLYREWYLEERRCLNARKKLGKRFEDL